MKINVDIAPISGGEALVNELISNQTQKLFLVPGIQLDYAVDALAGQTDIDVIVPRHEQTVSYMADGYSRVTGKPGVGMVVPGPGMLNAGAGLSTAYACNSPMVMIVGQIHSESIGKGFGNLHELQDQSGVLEGITKWNTLVEDRSQLETSINSAFSVASSGRTGPVSVEIPYNLLMEKASPVKTKATILETLPPIDKRILEKAATLLDEAVSPVVYVGGGAINASKEIQLLAEKMSIPVVASDNGRGVLLDHHPMSFTSLSGRPIFAKADVVLVVGSRFMDIMTPTASWDQDTKKYIYINIDKTDVTPPRKPDVFLHIDAGHGVSALCDLVKKREVMTKATSTKIKTWSQSKITEMGILAEYVSAVRNALPDDGILVNELTQVGYLSRVGFEVRSHRSFIGAGYQGTLGYSFPTALGAAVAGEGRRVFALTGDGGFGWSYQELATAVRYCLPVTIILFNDGHFGNVRAIQRRTFGREFAVELENPDFKLLANAFSIPYVKANGPASLEGILKETISNKGPVLVEVPVGEMRSPFPLLRLLPLAGMSDEADEKEDLL